MSGPKLVGITCDQEVIARNRERLQRVGKEAYFGGFFKNVNQDIENTKSWIENYALSTLSQMPEGYGDPSEIVQKIQELKRKHVQSMDANKLQVKKIKQCSPQELNKMVCDRVRGIPKWKEMFIAEVSLVLHELQQDIDEYLSEERRRKEASEKILSSLQKSKEESERIKKEIENYRVETMKMGEYIGNRSLIPDVPGKFDDSKDEAQRPFSLDELAVIEMFTADIEEFSKCTYLDGKEKELIKKLTDDLLMMKKEKYDTQSKRSILFDMKINYQRLSKSVAELTVRHNEEMEQRSTLEIEYLSFCKALDEMQGDYTSWSITVLEEKVSALREKVEKQEERIYVEETIEEIMSQHGYASVSSVDLHDAERTSRIIFSDKSGKHISTSIGNGMIMMQVVGEGEKPPTQQEIKEQVEQQGAFCDMYPEIIRELEQRNIHIKSEKRAPVSEKYAINIPIDRQNDIKKSTKKFSFSHVSVETMEKELTAEQEDVPNVQYMEG